MRAVTKIAIIVALTSVASADEAGEAFDRGRALLASGSYAEACAAFERSMELDPQHGTLYNLANCQAKRGKVASAWRAYKTLAEKDPNAKRRDDAAHRAAALEPTLPRLRIAATLPGWTAKLDDEDVTAALDGALPVDPGDRVLVATHRDGGRHRETVKLAGGAVATVELAAVAPTRSPLDERRRIAMIATVGGGALAVIGLGFGISALGRWDEATAVCGGDTRCPDITTQARATEIADRARSHASVATALVLVGGAAVGFGAWYLRKHRAAAYVAPGTEASPLGVTVGGRF